MSLSVLCPLLCVPVGDKKISHRWEGGPITYGGEYFFTKGVNKHYKFWGVKHFYMQGETNVFHLRKGGDKYTCWWQWRL